MLEFRYKNQKISGSGSGQDLTAGDGTNIKNNAINVDAPFRGVMSEAEYEALPTEKKATGFALISEGTDIGEVYSTEETRIGTWIDGKPVYQRVFQLTAPSTGEHGSRAVYTMPEPIDTWIQLTALLNERGQWVPFPYVYPYADTATGLISEMLAIFGRDNTYETEPNTVRLIITNRFVNLPILLIVKYTKVSNVEEGVGE